jgi:hypothetical protein
VERSGRSPPKPTEDGPAPKREKQAKTVAIGFSRPLQGFDGKEGVDGSSPSEGSAKGPHVGAFPFRATCSLSNVGMEPCLELSHSERPRRSALRHGLRTRSSYSDGTGSAPLDSHLPSVVPGRHHCRWLDHEHNGAAKGMRTVHDAARNRHTLTGTEHERFAPLYLELKPRSARRCRR